MRMPLCLYSPGRLILDLDALPRPLYVSPMPTLYHHAWTAEGLGSGPLIRWALDQVMPQDKAFVDIGANIGTWALNFACGPKAPRVVAIEPNPDLARCIRMAALLNQCDRTLTVVEAAVANPKTSCTGTLHLTEPDGGGSSLHHEFLEQHIPSAQRKTRPISVWVCTLDALLSGLPEPELDWPEPGLDIGLMKVDVEGAELDVFRGAVETIRRCRPKIIFEAWPTEWYAERKRETFAFLESLGYRVLPISRYPEDFLAEPL